jgi:hypothetical protein
MKLKHITLKSTRIITAIEKLYITMHIYSTEDFINQWESQILHGSIIGLRPEIYGI